MISKLYHSLKAASLYVKAKCEQELDVTVTEEERYQACGSLQTCSNSLRWTERVIRSFITPHVKSKEPTMGGCYLTTAVSAFRDTDFLFLQTINDQHLSF